MLQVVSSPYYSLERRAFYRQVAFVDFHGLTPETFRKEILIGASKEEETQRTLGLSMTASGGVEYEAGAASGSASFSATLEQKLKVSTKARVERKTTETITVEPVTEKYAEARWHRR